MRKKAICTSSDDVKAAFDDFQVKILDGVAFHTSNDFTRTANHLSKAAVETIGTDRASVSDLQDVIFKPIVWAVNNNVEINQINYLESLYDYVNDYLNDLFSYVGPCYLFSFEHNVKALRSAPISILFANEFLDTSDIPRAGKDWSLLCGDGFQSSITSEGFTPTIGGLCWSIKTKSPKDLGREDARWAAGIFTSLFRLALRPANYCTRAKLGEIEPDIFQDPTYENCGMVYNSRELNFGGRKRHPVYKVDERIALDFHSPNFQERISGIFDAKNDSLGKRVGDGLGWLSRGRQCRDNSERLLYFFTALEALLSEQDQFTPVADSISRYASVILAKDISNRAEIYREMKGLYQIRSNLVHRGTRTAHLINSNTLQYFAESCFYFVMKDVNLKLRHSTFLDRLKSATHGVDWAPSTVSDPE